MLRVLYDSASLVGRNFGNFHNTLIWQVLRFAISSSDTYQVLSGLPIISSSDELSHKADLALNFKTACPKAIIL